MHFPPQPWLRAWASWTECN